MTVIFDRSAFHGEYFSLFTQSRLLSLTKRGLVLVHHTPQFMEETLSMYERNKNRDELRRQLPYLLAICNGRLFLPQDEVWHLELVQNAGPTANVFVKEWRRRETEGRILRGAFTEANWPEFQAALPHKDGERQKQHRQRMLYSEMRHEVAQKRRELRTPKAAAAPLASEVIHTLTDNIGTDIILKNIRHQKPGRIAANWSRNKSRSPIFTSFIEGLAYSTWYAAVQVNKPIDKNAQVDIQMLAYLHQADAIVTRDTKFLKDCFDEIWKRRGKRLLSPEQFLESIQSF